jgi:hypothetical protein
VACFYELVERMMLAQQHYWRVRRKGHEEASAALQASIALEREVMDAIERARHPGSPPASSARCDQVTKAHVYRGNATVCVCGARTISTAVHKVFHNPSTKREAP